LTRLYVYKTIPGGDDFDALTAERYGWLNRALPDVELDGFVDRLARRIASFDGQARANAPPDWALSSSCAWVST